MKLLFNKDQNGSDELKELLGYVDADMNFNNLRPDIVSTTNDIIDLVGKQIYKLASDAYHEPVDGASDELKELYEELIRVTRYPIGVNAYRLYAPTNDLAHTNNGRKMRQDTNEKQAFEWMLDRDNAEQEKRYFRALDDLIKFLDNLELHVIGTGEDAPDLTDDKVFENLIRQTWIDSDAYKATHRCFVRTVSAFNEFFPIQSRLILSRLTPGMEECERYEILPRIKKAKFDDLKAKLQAKDDFTDESDGELFRLIKKACALFAMAWSMKRFSVNLYPDGVLQHYTSDRATTRGEKPSLNIEPFTAEKAFRADCDKTLLEIEALLAPAPEADDVTPIVPTGCSSDKFMNT